MVISPDWQEWIYATASLVNHCTSAMMPGGVRFQSGSLHLFSQDQNEFASLINMVQLCDDGTAWGSSIQQINMHNTPKEQLSSFS